MSGRAYKLKPSVPDPNAAQYVDHRPAVLAASTYTPPATMPTEFDLRKTGCVPSVLNQGSLGC